MDVFEILITQKLLKCLKDPFVRSVLIYIYIYMPTKYHKSRGGSRISGKGVHLYKGECVSVCVCGGGCFADSIYFS